MRLALCIGLLTACVAERADVDERDNVETAVAEDPSPRSDYERWVACIQFSDFEAANLATVWGASCAGCHTGAFGGESRTFFDLLRTRTYVQLTFFGFDYDFGRVVVNERTIPTIAKSDAHPRFDAAPGMTALRDFYNRTQTRFAAGTCRQ